MISPSLYTATAQIIVDPRDKQVVSNDINPSSVSPDGGIAQVESQVSVVQSGGVLLRAIAATHLEADPEFNGASALGGILALIEQPWSPSPERIESDLQAKVVTSIPKTLHAALEAHRARAYTPGAVSTAGAGPVSSADAAR